LLKKENGFLILIYPCEQNSMSMVIAFLSGLCFYLQARHDEHMLLSV
jgi:hypothetical protein